mmetsp:Transcript_11846/g.31080  ORF Transcript_11846/g.31080 Transcript_11846/m.31080 type:complete len:89 (-) Transcript_11846:2567-2833(-)
MPSSRAIKEPETFMLIIDRKDQESAAMCVMRSRKYTHHSLTRGQQHRFSFSPTAHPADQGAKPPGFHYASAGCSDCQCPAPSTPCNCA